MEIRRPGGERPQNRSFHLSHVRPFACNERTSRIGGLDYLLGGNVSERHYGQVADTERIVEI